MLWSREAIQCSGHGLCESERGEECLCNRGWSTTDETSGVFCDKVGASAASTGLDRDPDEGKLTPSAVRQLLILGISALVGVIALSVLLYYVITYRRRQRESIRKTVIEFPQPQLDIPAEKRPDASVMVPDESGWTNFEVSSALPLVCALA
jgi:hypothetical protein